MAKLITDAIFAKIRKVTNDVQETFFQKTAVYRMDTNALQRFNSDMKSNRVYTDIDINIMCVWENESNTENSNDTADRNSSVDKTRGYVLTQYDEAVTAGLVDVQQFVKGNTPQDLIVFDGHTFKITGVNLLGQLKDKYTVVKFHIEKTIQKS